MSHPTSPPPDRPPALRGEIGWYFWAVTAAFGTYFCMYAFRKPFTSATYGDLAYWGIGYKSLLVTSQVVGYMTSKFLGIKFVSEMRATRRALGIIGLITWAEIALLLFAIIPAPYNAAALFLNGLPLGMVFGLVLGYLEGRRATEALTAGLCASFILADGVTKSVGAYLLEAGVTDNWMPFTAGLMFLPPLLLFVWMLTRIPQPSARDVASRSERLPMDGGQRKDFFGRNGIGLAPILVMFLLVTIMRSIRADFAPEIWQGLGYEGQPSIFTRSELLVAIGVLVINGANIFVGDNRYAFLTGILVSIAGILLIPCAILALQFGSLGGFSFMTLVGLGLYLPYVAVHTTIFERLIAMTRDSGNICFLMYVADALGYLGYVAVMLGRGGLARSGNMLGFFQAACWGMAVASAACLIWSWFYFTFRRAPLATGAEALAPVEG